MSFARGRRGAGQHARHRKDRQDRQGRQDRQDRQQPAAGDERSGRPGDPVGPDAAPVPDRRVGPYDSAQSPPPATRLDLGSLQIPSVTGVQVRVQANQQGAVQRVMLVHGESALHLVALAAPRTEPIWHEVREDIRRSLAARQLPVEEVNGAYGVELRARVPGEERTTDVRFVGVDGPRWLLRADFHGPAARDPAGSPELIECLHGLVVDRGAEARPAKEPLPLQLSTEMAAQVQQQAAAAAGRPSPQPRGTTPSTVDRM